MSILKRPDNRVLYFIITILYTTGFMFCSGTILQTFMLNVGMDEATVSVYSAVTQFVQVVVIFAMTFLADKLKRIIKLYASIVMSVSLIAVALMLCVFVRSDLTAVKVLIFASSIVVYFMIGIRSAIDYKIIYEIFDMDNVGKLMGVVIAVSGAVSFGVSAVYSFAITKFDYYDVMTVFFIMSAVMIVISSAGAFSYKRINEMPESEKGRGLDFSIFKSKVARALAAPSLFRGFSNGVIMLVTVAGFSKAILTTQTSTYVSIITQATTFFGNIFFAVICKRVANRTTLLISSLVVAAAMPLTVMHCNLVEFLIAYAVSYFAYMVVSISIPMLLCEIVPYEQMGAFTCIRMMLFTFGSVIASVLYKPLADLIGYTWLFVCAGVLQAVCGVVHYIVARREQVKPKAAQL